MQVPRRILFLAFSALLLLSNVIYAHPSSSELSSGDFGSADLGHHAPDNLSTSTQSIEKNSGAAASSLVDDELLQSLREQEHAEDFDEALRLNLPLSPAEMRRAREKREAFERARNPSPARMQIETRTLPSTPASVPEVIRLTQGYSSTLVFQDSEGKPWPVLNVVIGNPEAFSALQPKDRAYPGNVSAEGKGAHSEDGSAKEHQDEPNSQGHILNIVPLTERASSNIAVNLEGYPYPVIIHLITDSPFEERRTSDALVIFRLNARGPKAEAPPTDALSSVLPISDEILNLIHGLPIKNARLLASLPELPETSFYARGDDVFLRTRNLLVWPAWRSVVQGEDIRVYVFQKTRSVVLSVDGNMRTLRLEEKGEKR